MLKSLSEESRQLLKIALITSPIIGMYMITPMWLYISSVPEIEKILIERDPGLSNAFIGISVFVFLNWLWNLFLMQSLDRILKRKIPVYLKYFLSYAIILAIVTIARLIRLETETELVDLKAFSYYPILGTAANNTLILIVYNLISARSKKNQLELDKTKLELAQKTIQQEHLKSKIHPHFLFNALNTLSILIRSQQNKAEEYLLRLSNFLRYSISESEKDVISFQDDLEFCENYIELQKVRFADAVVFYNEIDQEQISNSLIPVVTLQSLAENAIKHNALSKDKPLKLTLRFTEDGYFSFSNNINKKFGQVDSTGTGLKNLKERFSLQGLDEPIINNDVQNQVFEVKFKGLKK